MVLDYFKKLDTIKDRKNPEELEVMSDDEEIELSLPIFSATAQNSPGVEKNYPPITPSAPLSPARIGPFRRNGRSGRAKSYRQSKSLYPDPENEQSDQTIPKNDDKNLYLKLEPINEVVSDQKSQDQLHHTPSKSY